MVVVTIDGWLFGVFGTIFVELLVLFNLAIFQAHKQRNRKDELNDALAKAFVETLMEVESEKEEGEE